MTQHGPVGTRLPRIRGRSLAGVPHDFPGCLTAEATLLLVAFRQWQQRQVDTWVPTAARLATEHTGFEYFEIPLIGRRYRPARAFIDGGMRAGIPDPAVRATTVTAYQNVAAFLEPLELGSTDAIVVLLVDRSGEIRWWSPGGATPERTAELAAMVADLTAAA